ncbi:MAG: hypothetical protein Q9191_001513, partial [Dirinaria sp. TL-2023a]
MLTDTYPIAGGNGQSRPTSSSTVPAQTTPVNPDQSPSGRITSQPGPSPPVPNSFSYLPGTIPGCTSTQTAVVFGTTTYIPRPCLSGGNGPNTVPVNTLNDKGPPHNVPRPQSTADGLGSAGGLMSAAPQSYKPKAPAPKTTPVQKASVAEPRSTPAATKPVGEHVGGKGGMPIPRPQSSVTDLGPPEPTTAQAAPPAQSSDQPGGGGRVPRPESSVKFLEPLKPSPSHPAAPKPSPPQTGHADHFSNLPRPQSSVTSLGPAKVSHQPEPVQPAPNPSQPPSTSPTAKPLPLPAPKPVPISTTPPPIITIGSSTLTADSSSHFVVGSQTLAPGSSAITDSGTVYSIPSSGSAIVIGPSTQSIAPAAPASAPVIILGSSTLTANSVSQFQIGSQTLAPGSVITANGQTISLASSASAVVINSNTQSITPQIIPPSPVIAVAGSVFTGNSASEFQIGSETLKAGGPAITNSAGQVYSLAPSASAIVINGQTSQVTPGYATPAPVITLGASKITANAQSQYVIGSQTLSPGASITVSNRVLSLASGGSALVFGASTQALATPSKFTLTQPPILTLPGNGPVTANSNSAYVVDHQTLKPGQEITLHGSTISLAPSASALVINGHTTALTPHSVLATVSPPLITLGPSILTPNAKSAYLVDGKSLSPGGPAITFHGTRLSLAPDGTDLIVGSSTSHLSQRVFAVSSTEAPTLTVGHERVTADSAGDFILGSQTLSPGGHAITVSGTVVSLASDDAYLKIGSKTEGLGKHSRLEKTSSFEPSFRLAEPTRRSSVSASPTSPTAIATATAGKKSQAGRMQSAAGSW